jgi:hypothetical protein
MGSAPAGDAAAITTKKRPVAQLAAAVVVLTAFVDFIH